MIVTHDPVVSEQVQRTVAIRDGRTSTETLRRTELGDDGDHRVISEEFAVLDRAGRLQLPKQHIEALELQHRVRLRLEDDHVGVWPDRNGNEKAEKRTTRGPGSSPSDDRVDGRRRRSAARPARRTPAEPLVEAIDLVRDYPIGDGRRPRPARRSTWRSRRASSSPSAAGRGAARRRSSTCSAASTSRRPAGSSSTATRSRRWTRTSSSTSAGGRVAFVFQAFGLVPFLTATENVEVPLRLVHAERARARPRGSRTLLDLVGLADRAKHRPHELSGGEQQRVAIARALANRPRLLLADEPTGQLDSDTGHVIMLLLRSIVRTEGITAVVATHDPADARRRRPRRRAARRRGSSTPPAGTS